MNFFAISGLLNGIAAISLAILVYTRSPKDPRHWSYGLLGLSIAVWSLAYFSWQLASTHDTALVFARLLMAGAIFIPVTQLHHVLYLTNDSDRLGTVLKGTYLMGGFFLLVDATPYFVADVQPASYFLFWPQPGPFFHLFLVWWGAVALYSCYLLALAYQREKRLRRKQFFYLLIASIVAYLGGATNFPLWYGIEILPYGTICFTFYVALVAYTLLRYRLMDFSVFLEKGLSYLAVLLLISQPAYPVLLLAQKSVFGAISYRYSMVQLFVHLLTVAGAYQMRLGARRSVSGTVFRGQDSSMKALSQFSTNISTLQDMNLLGQEIVNTLSRGMRAHTAILYVLNEEKSIYTQVSDFGDSVNHGVSNVTFAITDDLPRYLSIVQTRVFCQELKQSFPDQWKQRVLIDLEKLGADVCFPFIRKNRLLGFCLISPCSPESFEAIEALGFVSTLVREAALALENSILREEVIRSQAIVRHMDRLRSLETMSGGLAQELTNSQSSIKAFVQLAQLRKNDEEFLGRFQTVISSDVLRIESLTKEIREYASHELSGEHTQENMNELVESCVAFISLNLDYQHIKIETSLDHEIPTMYFRRQEMRQVLFNLLLHYINRVNNVEPMEKSLFLKTQSITSSTGDKWIQVELSDIQVAPTFDVLLPSFHSGESTYAGLEKSDLDDHGLTIAREIVGMYAGYIQVYSSKTGERLVLLSLPVVTKSRSLRIREQQSLLSSS
ncbi:histidine kinase N-terminal 7TM domain-containing protein [Nitrospira sp. M1]